MALSSTLGQHQGTRAKAEIVCLGRPFLSDPLGVFPGLGVEDIRDTIVMLQMT